MRGGTSTLQEGITNGANEPAFGTNKGNFMIFSLIAFPKHFLGTSNIKNVRTFFTH